MIFFCSKWNIFIINKRTNREEIISIYILYHIFIYSYISYIFIYNMCHIYYIYICIFFLEMISSPLVLLFTIKLELLKCVTNDISLHQWISLQIFVHLFRQLWRSDILDLCTIKALIVVFSYLFMYFNYYF